MYDYPSFPVRNEVWKYEVILEDWHTIIGVALTRRARIYLPFCPGHA